MTSSFSEAEQVAGQRADRFGWPSFVLAYGTGLLVVLADLADGRRFSVDIDDTLRALQIRFLLSGNGSWYDMTLPFIASPEPYVSPWSRLVDLPYAVLAKGLSLVMPADQALQAAFQIWPLVMLALFSLLSVLVAGQLARGMPLAPSAQRLSIVLMTVFMSVAVLEFAPGRIDHHNVQILALLLMAAGASFWNRLGGALVGIGSTLSVFIGLEGLPFVVVAYAVVIGAFIGGASGARSVLLAASLGMLATTVVASLAFLGVPAALSAQCDAVSAPYLLLMVGLSIILALASGLLPQACPPLARMAAVGLPSVGLLALVGSAFPACLSGPFTVIDPLSRTYWFDRIAQEYGILHYYADGQFAQVSLVALVTIVLVASGPLAWRKVLAGNMSWLLVYGMAAVSVLLTVLLVRYIRFPAAFVPLFIPALVAWASQEQVLGRRTLIGAATLCAAVFVVPGFLVSPLDWRPDAVDYMTFDECTDADFSVLNAVTPGGIAAPNGVSLPILLTAPEGFSVAAVPFHRASPGMRRMYEAFLSSDPAVRKAALAPFDYVVVCRFPLESDPVFAPLYAALSAGRDWPGLVRIASSAETRFQLFRIDHAALE